MDKKCVAIIGAGISGLLACKHAIDKGFKPIVFEARNGIGGVWSCTIHSTKLQTPKQYFQFSDFPWPDTLSESFPTHDRVMDYLESYARHFDLLPFIKFNSRVVRIEYTYHSSSDEDMKTWELWGGNGEAFSTKGWWKIVVEDVLNPMEPCKVYQAGFVILCLGNFSDLPNIPDFLINQGRNGFEGEIMHSMDYAAMDKFQATKLVANKRVAVVGFHKSALDIAAEIAENNGPKYPCTLVFRRVQWLGSEDLATFTTRNLNRFLELMIHKPGEGLILCFLAFLLSPLRWIFCKLIECYLKWTYPLKKYNMVPHYSFLEQVYSCMFMILPRHFYDRVKEGRLILRKSHVLGFWRNGLTLSDGKAPLEVDVVIFATGYKSDEKLANIFASTYFKKCIIGSSTPFYRECIHPRIPNLAILGYPESPTTLFTFEMRSKWIGHFLAGKLRLPAIRTMEDDVRRWEENARRYSRQKYKRSCVGVMLQIHSNDQLCRDVGCTPTRKKWFLPELFSAYLPSDYADV